MSETESAGGETPIEAPAPPPPPEPEPEPEQAPEPEPPHTTEQRRLMRSRDNRVIAGVCGGLGEYLGVDAVLIRIAALILLFAGGAGFFLYVIGWIAMPEAPPGDAAATTPGEPGERTASALVLGLIFVGIGVFFLLDKAFPDILEWGWIWPVALIAVGALVLLRARR